MKSAMRKRSMLQAALMILSLVGSSEAFSVLPNKNPHKPSTYYGPRRHSNAATTTRLYSLPDINAMRVKEMREELESYGISTRTFLEKREFTDALTKAREEGLEAKKEEPKKEDVASAAKEYAKANGKSYANGYSTQAEANGAAANGKADPKTQTKNGRSQTNKGGAPGGATRAESLQAEIENAKSMRVSELKQKLKEMGVKTSSFFEKSEFVRAYAEAMVDGLNNAGSSEEEDWDPEYRDVVMQKFDPNTQQKYLLGGTIIDIKL